MKNKTAPWLPIQTEWWPAIVEAMQKPWPIEAVYLDLRWWADQEAMGRTKRPGRPALRARWGWSDRTARNAMKDGAKWERSSQGPARVQRRSSQGPETDMQTPDIIIPRVQPRSSGGPAEVQPESPRVYKQKTEDRTQKTENTITSDRLAPVRQLWSELNQVRVDLDSRSKPLKLTDARQRTLKARLKEHTAQDVVAVVKWWLQSSHQRAQYLRDNGYGIDTVLRPSNFTTYLELSRVPPPKPKLATVTRMGTSLSTYSAPRRTNEPPALSHYSERQIAAVKADLEDLQATCKPDTWDRMVRTALAQSYGRAAK